MEEGDTLTRRRRYAKINVKKEMLADKRLAQYYVAKLAANRLVLWKAAIFACAAIR